MFKTKSHFLLTKDEQIEIIEKIKSIENKTSGELRLAIRNKKNFFERKKTSKEVALKTFYALNMHKTKDKTGVLLFILVEDKKLEIIADSGINEKVEKNVWENFVFELSTYFIQNKFKEGIIVELEKIGNLLSQHFPQKENDIDELSNEISFS